MTLRLRGSKTELEEMGEDVSDMATTTSQLQAKLLALTGGQVDIMLDANTFKNSTQILREMAAAWEDMTDIQRASALELMGGKRQANVLSALIQNFDTVEDVIETSANSAGSALKENERYLDSIQGKIDQFNNAMQAMWNNTLNSDMVKGFVALGTEIIKIIDKIGLLNSALLAFGAYKGFGHLFKTLSNAGVSLNSVAKSVWAYITGVEATTVAEKKLTQVQLTKKLTAQGMTAENAKAIVTQTGLGVSTDTLTKETLESAMANLGYKQSQIDKTTSQILGTSATEGLTLADRLFRTEMVKTLATQYLTTQATQALEQAKYALKLAEMGLMNGIATTKDVQAAQAAVEAASIPVDITKIGTTELMGLAFKQLALSIWAATEAIVAFLFTNPVGWAILAATAIIGAVAAWNKWGPTTENLTERLEELKSELSDIRSELDSVNQELKTSQERMAELLAMDSLTFEEQEELDRLRETNDELERRKELLETEETNKADRVGRQAASVVNSKRDEIGTWLNGKSESEEVLDYIEEYQKLRKDYNDALSKKKQDEIQEKLDEKAENIDEYISVISEALDGVEYGDSEESDAALDYLAQLENTYAIARGSAGAKTHAIKGIMEKDEFSATTTAIDMYVEKLREGDASAKASIDRLLKGNFRLVAELKANGLELEDALNYYTELGSVISFTTEEAKAAENERATASMNQLLDDLKSGSIDVGSLFDEEGKIIQTKLSEMFKGTSETTRAELTKILEASYDGIADGLDEEEAAKLMGRFGIALSQGLLDVKKQLLAEQNFELFPNLKEEIDGIIDSFDEMHSALNSVVDAMDLLEQARAEEAYSGSISLETMSKLMEQTDDYAKILEVDEYGAIKLVAGAEDVLIDQRIAKIKTDAAAAVETAENAYQDALLAEEVANLRKTEAEHAYQTVTMTGPSQTWFTGVMAELSGWVAYVQSLWNDIMSGNFSGSLDRASAAYNDTKNNYAQNKYDEKVGAAAQALEEATKAADAAAKNTENADKERKQAQNNANIVNKITKDNIKASVKSDYADGTEDDDRDKTEDGWEKLVNKYENKLALLSNERDLIQAEIDKAEARGGKASAKYYEDLVNNSAAEKTLLEEKKAALEEYLEANAGAIDQDTWTDYNNEINETAVAIKECEINTLEWEEAIREIDLHYFEQASEEISRLGDELEFVNGLLEDEEVADENGNWSSAALTRMGLYANQMEMAAANAARYQEEIDDLNDEYENGAISEEQYQERLSDLVSSQQDAIMSYEDAKDSIVELNEARIDAIREGIEKEIEAYEDLIEAKKEELDAERDLHDFRKNIQKQTKDIASLERRIASLSGSSAASDIAERRKLEQQLMEAKEGLNDTYYDHSRDAQSAALDEENEAYALSKEKYIERLEEQLKDTETLISNSIMDVMLNADTVYNELNTMANTYGITLSDELTQPWKDASAQAIKWKDELKLSMTSGEYASLIGEGGAVTAFANGVATKLQGSWTKAQTAAKNYAGYLTGAELKNGFTNTLTGFGNQIQTIIDKWNGVKKAADDAYAAQTRKVTVGGTGSGDTGGADSPSAPSGAPSGVPSRGPTPVQLSEPEVKLRGLMKTSKEMILGSKSFVDANTETINGTKYYRDSKTGYYYKISDLNSKRKYDGGRTTGWAIPKGTWFYTKHAKGTTGTTRDEWALTDEPQFGDELVLVPGKDGNLSFMRKGTGVVPADMTQKLFELAQIPTSDLMNKNLTAIVPNITKNDFKNEFNFESLVHVDTVDSDTLPKLEKMVDKKIDDFSKALNYSLKRFAR